ncbi:MAG: sigma-70 family RNA polymerase sigma factor [Acidobacteria bacterium]|nr:sigma-70 family RNA polymerase sigma factor [Acidobacteriota bacterium]MCW5949870.1 sigma-70 family RNA polymerase sigma factor [Pyrinomonadaceae bacterium]
MVVAVADGSELNALMAEAYAELRRLASFHLRSERRAHTLRPTELVHETYLRLLKQHSIDAECRVHFLSLASTIMRRVLVDHARRKKRAKRGSGVQPVTLDRILTETRFGSEPEIVDILALEEALNALSLNDPDQARIVEMHFFGGLTFEEVAQVQAVSLRTVMREWKFARTWLYQHMKEGNHENR